MTVINSRALVVYEEPVIVDDSVDVLDALRILGRDGGKGADSLAKAAMFSCACVAMGVATDKDAEAHYDAWASGFDEEVILGDNLADNPDSRKSQLSTYRAFMKPGIAKHGEVLGRAIQMRSKLAKEERKHSAYNGLVAVARAQNKAPAKALTNDELRAILSKDEAVAKTEMEKLVDLLKRVNTVHKDFGGMFDVIASTEARIAACQRALDEAEAEEARLSAEAAGTEWKEAA